MIMYIRCSAMLCFITLFVSFPDSAMLCFIILFVYFPDSNCVYLYLVLLLLFFVGPEVDQRTF